jgi:hypothetical protein
LLTGPYAWQEIEGIGRKASRPPGYSMTRWHTRDKTIQFRGMFLKFGAPSPSRCY